MGSSLVPEWNVLTPPQARRRYTGWCALFGVAAPTWWSALGTAADVVAGGQDERTRHADLQDTANLFHLFILVTRTSKPSREAPLCSFLFIRKTKCKIAVLGHLRPKTEEQNDVFAALFLFSALYSSQQRPRRVQ